MSSTALLAAVLALAAIVELAVPGRPLFQTGWYATVMVALVVVAIAGARGEYRRAAGAGGRAGVVLAAFGAAILGLAIVANALFAPEPRTIIAAPGQHVAVAELGGMLAFPVSPSGSVSLVRPGRPPAEISEGPHYVGSFVLRAISRNAVAVSAANGRGERLTVTQPSGAAFLSPVLLMEQTQSIAGMDVRYDSFAVPAVNRLVRAVLFNPQQAAQLHNLEGPPGFAVRFSVDDGLDRPIHDNIRIVHDGGTTTDVGGGLLHADVVPFPSVEVVAIPSLPASILGVILAIAGFLLPLVPSKKV